MLCLPQEEGRSKAGCGLGLAVALVAVLVVVLCVICALLLILGPTIGNIFNGVESGLQ